MIASEDRHFYRHGGVDGKALVAAAFSVLGRPFGGGPRGASTISMQLADLLPWSPLLGKHTLSLVDEARRRLDSITFEVRGSALASQD